MARMESIQRYCWLRDSLDARDHIYAESPRTLAALPSSVDLTANCLPVYAQGKLGSCTVNAIGAAIEFDRMNLGRLSCEENGNNLAGRIVLITRGASNVE
jgi:hypothetical protein